MDDTEDDIFWKDMEEEEDASKVEEVEEVMNESLYNDTDLIIAEEDKQIWHLMDDSD